MIRRTMSWTQKLSMAVCVLFGFVYVGWIAWTESWEFWIVASAVGAMFAVGYAIHRLMDAARGD